MGDARHPAFDRNGKFLYFTASTNSGATSDGLDMTSDLYNVTSGIYAAVLASDQASPVAPDLDDEKSPAEAKEKAKDNTDTTPAGEAAKQTDEAKKDPTKSDDKAAKPKPPKPHPHRPPRHRATHRSPPPPAARLHRPHGRQTRHPLLSRADLRQSL